MPQTLENAFTLDINPLSVSIGGISAGAHLACVLQHRARDANIALKLLIAAVPPLADHDQYEKPTDSPWPSFSEFSHIPMLNWERMSFFKQQAFPTEKLANIRHMYPAWWISPLRAPNFANLCDTFIATAECDILRDEGEAYGKKLIEAGNRVTFRRYLKVPHSFMYMTSVLPQAEQYQEDVFNALRVGHGL
ncbi:uncharacterized protein N7479_005368 [Penicillium vulpinum]|uniref:uncharacterized protein n=1 Tax=Penicillium vulpinum TaxID=29845 RepID=UPI0025467D42|nr:uncharacterized protein N7479_005368 [Penicillium vulpinum]KAJ5958218.1 hypothetical protein N7479_005368 [Penicillium vulpinum]